MLLFGGTTEGRQLSTFLEKKQCHHLYSTKSAQHLPPSAYRRARQGALDHDALMRLCCDEAITLMLDASHPFADALHQTAAGVAGHLGIPLWRLERPVLPVNYAQAVLCSDYPDLIRHALAYPAEPLLIASGVQSLAPLMPLWQSRDVWARILKRSSSRTLATSLGFPATKLINMLPPQTLHEELALWQQHGIKGVILKESGASGFQHIKLQAAETLGMPAFVLKRPPLPPLYQVMSAAELQQALTVKQKDALQQL